MPDNTTLTSMEDLMDQTGAETSNAPYDEEDDRIEGQQYLATFQDLKDYEDLYEERTSSIVSGVHFETKTQMQEWIAKGYQMITVEEQEALVNGGVRRKSDGAIVDRPPVIVPLEDRIARLISQINDYTANRIVGGFAFEVTSGPVTGTAKFDSSKEDQMTFATMYAASKSPDFETTPPYNGFIPMRGYKAISGGFEPEKTVFYLNAENMQRFSDALALHIGTCKTEGWQLQNTAKAATAETIDTVEQQIWQAIGYDPENR